MTLGLTDLSPWADNMGEPRAWHNLKYLWHTLGIRKNPKGNQNTSASVILEDTRLTCPVKYSMDPKKEKKKRES